MNIDALREAIRVVIDHGQGERLLGMLAESDPAGPNWPLLAALRFNGLSVRVSAQPNA